MGWSHPDLRSDTRFDKDSELKYIDISVFFMVLDLD